MSVYEITLLLNGEEQSEDIVEHNGKQYRKVKRKAAVGELVVVVEDFAYGKLGEVHTVLEDDIEMCALVTDKAPLMYHSRYEVLAEVEQTPTLTERDLIANLAQEVAELKRQLTNAQSDIADLEDRLDENEKDVEEVIGRINDLGDDAEAAAVDFDELIAKLNKRKEDARDAAIFAKEKGYTNMHYMKGGISIGLSYAINILEGAVRND